ncbi:MBL fold metallo-hydrolase [Vibrio sp. S4M6]|uniref:alkyl/aryl-sulfatase n=1 Tax=Vibrio sinus TaxID=2946865 RepID=UPI002029E91A|nr:alkyl sulfatase dimerization domain-containing protein [Vibrio sinus]MCL9780677.1 MBL fold metallo-hydrolase [Vibrio sinus]
MNKKCYYILPLSLISMASLSCSASTFTSAPKPATPFTIHKQEQVLKQLDFKNRQDFTDASRGFIASWPYKTITDSHGHVVWRFDSFNFLNHHNDINTINPSLLRNAQLNNKAGLFKVTKGIYQIRGFDLSVMSFIRGKHGWIVVDPLISPECSAAGLKLLREKVADLPVSAVIFTHSHVDHFGGIWGVITPKQVASGKVPIVAPKGFFEHAISENVEAGNAMSRRASYAYGNLLPINAKGLVDAGIGKTTSTGKPGIVKPTIEVDTTGKTYTVDGVKFVAEMANKSEAPVEFMAYFPKQHALLAAEVATHTYHNISTLRGAQTRDANLWAHYLDQALQMFGDKAQVMFSSHQWPTWGQKNIDKRLANTRDMYKYVNDQTLHLADEGYTLNEIPAKLHVPASIANQWYNRGYYGTISHNARATYDYYFGAWWDGNPANLNPLTPTALGAHYVKAVGGEKKAIEIAKKAYNKGQYRWVVTLLNNVTFSDPHNMQSRYLEADAMEQLGYQAESALWRNEYLTGAKELREGIKPGPTPDTTEMTANLPMKDFLSYLAVTVKPTKAMGMDTRVNIKVSGDKDYALHLSNSVLKSYVNKHYSHPDITVTLSEQAYKNMMAKKTTLKQEIQQGNVKVSNIQKFDKFMGVFDTMHNDRWFGIVTP